MWLKPRVCRTHSHLIPVRQKHTWENGGVLDRVKTPTGKLQPNGTCLRCLGSTYLKVCARPTSTLPYCELCLLPHIFISYTMEEQTSLYKADTKYLRLASPYSNMPLQGKIKLSMKMNNLPMGCRLSNAGLDMDLEKEI